MDTTTDAKAHMIEHAEKAAEAANELAGILLDMGSRWHRAYVQSHDLRHDLACYLDQIAPQSPYSNGPAAEQFAREVAQLEAEGAS